LASFLSKLTEEENVYSYFIQDCTLSDTADFSVAALEDCFAYRLYFADCCLQDFQVWISAFIICWGYQKVDLTWTVHVLCKTLYREKVPKFQDKISKTCQRIFSVGVRPA